VKEEVRETAMELLATMMLRDRAEREGRSFTDVFSEVRRSKTFEHLFDPEYGLWMNGPDYISEEYDLECQRKKDI